ncbi:MAG: plastocyanin/azurin family copper-binding protein [Microthrixaceae bacterium]
MAIDQENTDTADESAGAPASSTRKGGTTFETLAVCGFIFGMFAIAAAVFAVGLAARAVTEAEGGGGGGEAAAGSGGPTVQEVTLGDFFIDPADAAIASGAVLDLTNEGAVEHDLAIGDVVSDKVAPGESGTFDTAGVEPGSYEWYCTVPGHKEAGMTGTVTVE